MPDDTMDETCPWCGEKLSDLWEIAREGDIVNFECGSCEKPLEVRLYISYDYTVSKDKSNGEGLNVVSRGIL